MTRIIHFAVQFVIIGLAVAFLLVWLRPELLPAGRQQAASPATSYADAVNRTARSVVSVYTRTMVTEPLGPEFSDPLFNRLYRDRTVTRPRRGLGSGVIISSDGLVLTTQHVISDVDDILVALWDGRVADASVVGSDPATDLALLRVNLDDLPVASLAEDDDLRTGDVVLAIGNAFGLSHTVTMGIVSATSRGHLSLASTEDFIQTDAAINAGNSGGALINPDGEVVGINSASMGQETGAQGISFAIPASVVRRVTEQIIEYGRVTRGWMGAELTDVSLRLATAETLQPGARVSQVHRDSPAWKAGLQRGDVLISAGGQQVRSARELMQRIAGTEPGSELELEVLRGNQVFTTSVELIQQPPPQG
ncbi:MULTISPECIES: S1C family serine protease [unclassified Wenzhouxiangella]|uniref:S1C family serine protease n=1 Tax=unclassified Wenzhouxiangella TaxID=2613841 RepID=UPI000E32A18A|nr:MULTISPECIES: trypsin-like peptidase domain-containing protein [unclassified Wenzhouxiangella]RFF28953.1 PDZ domain-containing protein [Wenzhouxiangella sp. 15181]RFP68338.1 PDZ domain-containing protein [Wenzhouxiangella sp. 15190]